MDQEQESRFLDREHVKNNSFSWFQYLNVWTGSATISNSFKAEEELLGHYIELQKGAGNSASLPVVDGQVLDKPKALLELVRINATDWINHLRIIPHHASFAAPTSSDGADVTTTIQEKKNVVLLHGFGAGLGFFAKNYPALAKTRNCNVFALDWLGMGNSSRPSFPKKMDDHDDNVNEAELFFIDSLEQWRKTMNIERMVLVGHSLGGYLTAKYALKYPKHVEKLVLVSPVGVPKLSETLPDNHDPNYKPSFFYNMVQTFWKNEWSPQSGLRMLGPLGYMVTNRYATRRFREGQLQDTTKKSFAEYIYQISASQPSGEYSAMRLLFPHVIGVEEVKEGNKVKATKGGIYARKPIEEVAHLFDMPVTFLYGTNDWMDHTHALKVAPLFKVQTKVGLINNAGHHLYIDNADGFDHALLSELDEVTGDSEHVSYPFLS